MTNKTNQPNYRKDRNEQIIRWYQDGLSIRRIADGVGLSFQRVQQILAAHDIERRPVGRTYDLGRDVRGHSSNVELPFQEAADES